MTTNILCRLLFVFGALLAGAGRLTAQPAVNAVTNGADFSLATLAPGSLATIFGSQLASSTVAASSVPFPTSLNTTSVNVNGRPAPMVYVSSSQIDFLIPYETAPGTAKLVVSTGGQSSTPFNCTVASTAVGLFQYGTRHGAIQNHDYTLNSDSEPAASGSTILVYLTGIGKTNPAVADGAAAPAIPLAMASASATATVGTVNAPVQFIGLTPGSVGLAQANIQVPTLDTGDYPLGISMNGVGSTLVTVSVQGASNPTITPVNGPPITGCVSGKVDFITFFLGEQGLPDEASIGGTKLCSTCNVKTPLSAEFGSKLKDARDSNMNVKACYDATGNVDLISISRP